MYNLGAEIHIEQLRFCSIHQASPYVNTKGARQPSERLYHLLYSVNRLVTEIYPIPSVESSSQREPRYNR